jgi:hypothetical protein
MKRLSLLLICAPALLFSQKSGSPFTGRWDFTVTTPNTTYPNWMEYSATQLRVQPRGGSVHPVSVVKEDGSKLTLLISKANAKQAETTWELSVSGDQITGTELRGGKEAAKLAGVRAPALHREMPKAWSTPESLFNGKDLTGWEPTSAATNNWGAEDGVLLNKAHGANLKSTRKFEDFKLHIEYNCPDEGNSGIYLRGRYEVQVEYEKVDANDRFHSMGAIYGFISPEVELPRRPGTWETYDITLVGRNVTVVRNGVKTIDNQEIPGITGGALDSHEAEPGPFYFQGDHTGGMKYRNIQISVPKR